MEIHKPKAAHTIREFLTEIGTIICGILIALGLEQIAAAIHERKIAGEASESVRAEVRENLFWMERRAMSQACFRKRLDEVGAILANARQGQAFATPRHIVAPIHAKLTSLRWEANSQAGRTSLFTPLEQRYLGNMYYTTEEFRTAQSSEEEAWSKLSAMENLDRLTSYQIDQFGIFTAQARYASQRIDLSITRGRQWAERMHLTAESIDNPGAGAVSWQGVCASISSPPADA
jgi:hypothetical protein